MSEAWSWHSLTRASPCQRLDSARGGTVAVAVDLDPEALARDVGAKVIPVEAGAVVAAELLRMLRGAFLLWEARAHIPP